ncbi:MAG: hypothetical protein IPN29_14700 [Saprospiraceae bacterium]|nr:hypothetical protein [Saprospiraceae bacterium]
MSLSVSKNFTYGTDFSAAYAVNSKLGVLAKYSKYSQKDSDGNGEGSGNILELGFGYFKPISKFIVEGWITYGNGKFMNRFLPNQNVMNDDGLIDAKFRRICFQPALTYQSKFIAGSISLRSSYLNYYDIRGNLYGEPYSASDNLIDNNKQIIFEPAFTLRAGLKNIKFEQQIVWAKSLSNRNFEYSNIVLIWGLFVSI